MVAMTWRRNNLNLPRHTHTHTDDVLSTCVSVKISAGKLICLCSAAARMLRLNSVDSYAHRDLFPFFHQIFRFFS